jgi:FKBP-type peptidyl-prolyl cis-trans isomerase
MKKYALPLALISVVGLQACNEQPGTATASGEAAAPAEIELDSTERRLSYGVAYGLAKRMAADQVPMDRDAFFLGFSDGLDGSDSRVSDEQLQAEMQAYQQKMMAAAEAEQEKQGTANQAEAEAFLAENSQREGVITTESGLQYEVLEKGDGPVPTAQDRVEVHYTGTLIDGTEFDSSRKRGEPVTFGVTQVIAGWTEALQLMPVGSRYKLYIPPELGYGSGGAGQMIGPNAALVFDVELLSIVEPPAEDEAADASSDEAADSE